MDNQDIKIESFLKNKISNLVPSRISFKEMRKSVTDKQVERNSYVKAGIPSPYQLSHYFFMKKIAIIGIPLVLIVFLAVTQMNIKKNQLAKVEPSVKAEVIDDLKDASVDTIIASFSVDTDTSVAMTDSETATIDAELESFNNLKSTSYENNI